MTKEQFEKAKELYAERGSFERIINDYERLVAHQYYGSVKFQHTGYEPIDLHVPRDVLIDFVEMLKAKTQEKIDKIDREIEKL